ncbi:MAG: sulfurtransferase TusA family protein [Desulfitobacteriaceae bacterium]
MSTSADRYLDITDVVCPMTFVKAKVMLEDLEEGQILEIRMDEGEPIQNVPRSLKDEGHQVLQVVNNQDGTFTIFVKKDGL